MSVSSAAQLLQAIGSNRTIKVKPGKYQLDSVTRTNSRHIQWTKVYDGWQLTIKNVKNMTIVGNAAIKPRLLVNARYAWVIRFDNASNVRLRNLVLGHIPSGGCVGGVVAFNKSRNVRISNSELFGSGTIGVGLDKVVGFRMDNSTIRDCTYGILSIKNSSGVHFNRSTFKGNREYDLIEISKTRNVRFDHCTVKHNRTNGSSHALFKVDNRSNVILRGGSYTNNKIDTFINRRRRLRVHGSKRFRQSVLRQLDRPDPRFNQIYKVVRYRQWIVTGSQAGIVFWNPTTSQVDLLGKSFISSSFVTQGKYLWAGTYKKVFRFDGLQRKTYLSATNVRGHKLSIGPRGNVIVRQGKRYLRYNKATDKFVTFKPSWAPAKSPHDLIFRSNNQVWAIDFMGGISRRGLGTTKHYRIRTAEYPGRDPRAFYQSPTGQLWVSDFSSGFLRYDSTLDRFVKDPTVTTKGVGIAVDAQRKRTWLGHYNRGVYLKRPNKPVRFFAFANLLYMRSLHVDANGDLWVAGWNALVRLSERNGTWTRKRFVVR